MAETYIIKASKLAYPHIFASSKAPFNEGDPGEPARFRVSALVPADQATALPNWVTYKEAAWRNAPAGHVVVNLTTLFRIPIYGIDPAWFEAVDQRNLDRDRALAMAGVPAEVLVAQVYSQDRRGARRNFSDVIAIRVLEQPQVPTFKDLEDFAQGRAW